MYVEFATAFVFLCKMETHDPWNPSQRTESYPSNPGRPVINQAAESSLKNSHELDCTHILTLLKFAIRTRPLLFTDLTPPPKTSVTLYSLNNFCGRCNKY